MKHSPLIILVMVFAVTVLTVMILMLFHHPSSEVDASELSASAFISCLDLQRELNRRHPELKLKEDGICGRATQAAWDTECGNQYAIETWPEVKVRIVE